jgi:uncharacterized protein YndB with AHSA1/START domain
MEKAVDLNIEVKKAFTVSVERLYQAWTSENDLRQWWHPMHNQLKQLQNDLKPGGAVIYTFENQDGQEVFTINGTYKEVEQGKKLVYTWNWHLPTPAMHDSEFLLTVVFEPHGSGSQLSVRQEQIAHEEALHVHREGWNKALNDLEAYLNKQ